MSRSNDSGAPAQTLHRSEERFHALVDAVTDYAVFMLDIDGNVASWNPGAKKAKGYEDSEIIGRHFSTFYTPEDKASRLPQRLLDIVRTEGRVESEGWRVRKDGTRFWANVIITCLRDDAGALIGFAKVTRDLTERRKFEEELRISEERFRLLVEGVSDYAIYMLDPEGLVTTWNRGAERMKGYAASEAIGKHFSVFFPEEDKRANKPGRELEAARNEGRFEDEGWRVRKDGTRFWANVIVTAITDSQGRQMGFSKVTRDLSARRAAEQTERELLRASLAREAAERVAHEAQEANRIKDEFLATVSHELRTPLNAIVGWSKMLLQRNVDPAVARGLAVIDRNAEAQTKLIEDILDVARIISGKLRLETRPIDLLAIVGEAVEVVRPSAIAKHIEIEIASDAGAGILVGDPDRLQQVAWNLLSNAVKFTDPCGKVSVRIGQVGSSVILHVSDTGRGIDPAFLPYAFDRFKQEEGSTTRRVGGLGLGLALVRHITELHGGTVTAKSEGIGKGSSFSITLPIRAVSQAPAQAPGPSPSGLTLMPEPLGGALVGLRILVVDDDDDARDLVRTVLEGAGAFTHTAASASEAIEVLRRVRPDILVSDIGMPQEDGYSLMQRVRALGDGEMHSLPSIALTAYTRAEDRAKALAAGFTSHLGKPVRPEELLRAVAAIAVTPEPRSTS